MILLDWKVLSDGFTEAPEAIVIHGGSWRRKVRFQATAFLLLHPTHGPILVDTGYSQRFHEETQRFPGRFYRWATKVTLTHPTGIKGILENLGIKASDIRHLILTHFHGDHVGGLRDFPDAQVHCSNAAWEYTRKLRGFSAVRHGVLPGLIPEDFATRLHFVAEGSDVFGDGSLHVLALPGHAVGQIGLRFNDVQSQPVLLAADACWLSESFRKNLLPHGLTRLLHDWDDYRNSLQRLHDLHRSEPSLLIVPSHCPEIASRIVS